MYIVKGVRSQSNIEKNYFTSTDEPKLDEICCPSCPYVSAVEEFHQNNNDECHFEHVHSQSNLNNAPKEKLAPLRMLVGKQNYFNCFYTL